MKIYIVLEHPDMTYYGDAEIHGVYDNPADAEAKRHELDPNRPPDWSRYGVEEWQIGTPEQAKE